MKKEIIIGEGENQVTRTVFDGPGRGRKQCSNCENYIGVRNKVCPICNDTLQRRVKTVTGAILPPKKGAVAKPIAVKDPVSPWRIIIRIPAGTCPVRLVGTDRESVKAWGDKVLEYYHARKEHLMPEGLRYYARYSHDLRTDEYKTIAAHINEIYEADEDDLSEEVTISSISTVDPIAEAIGG